MSVLILCVSENTTSRDRTKPYFRAHHVFLYWTHYCAFNILPTISCVKLLSCSPHLLTCAVTRTHRLATLSHRWIRTRPWWDCRGNIGRWLPNGSDRGVYSHYSCVRGSTSSTSRTSRVVVVLKLQTIGLTNVSGGVQQRCGYSDCSHHGHSSDTYKHHSRALTWYASFFGCSVCMRVCVASSLTWILRIWLVFYVLTKGAGSSHILGALHSHSALMNSPLPLQPIYSRPRHQWLWLLIDHLLIICFWDAMQNTWICSHYTRMWCQEDDTITFISHKN